MYYILHIFSENNQNKSTTSVAQSFIKLAISENKLFFKKEENNSWNLNQEQWFFIYNKMNKNENFYNFKPGDTFYLANNIWALVTEIRDSKKDYFEDSNISEYDNIFNSKNAFLNDNKNITNNDFSKEKTIEDKSKSLLINKFINNDFDYENVIFKD